MVELAGVELPALSRGQGVFSLLVGLIGAKGGTRTLMDFSARS